MEKARLCKNCKRPFQPSSPSHTFCSASCRVNYHKTHKENLKQCIFCGEEFTTKGLPRSQWSKSHCFNEECEKRYWLKNLLKKYTRCKQCGNIKLRGKSESGSYNYCPFCVSCKRGTREKYAVWLKTLPSYIDVLIPNPMITLRELDEYVRDFDIEKIRGCVS